MAGPVGKSSRWNPIIGWVSLIYPVVAFILWLFMRLAGDRWWPATLLLFAPRWPWAMPLALLMPLAAVWRRRSVWPLLVAAWVVAMLVMDFRVPWRRAMLEKQAGQTVRVLSCNTHWDELHEEEFERLIAAERPDIVALQDTAPYRLPRQFAGGSWYILRDGELTLASRYPMMRIENIAREKHWESASAMLYEIRLPAGPVKFINAHLTSPRSPLKAAVRDADMGPALLDRNSDLRLLETLDLAQAVRDAGGRVLLAGDFNTQCDSNVYRQTFADFSDAFSEAGFGFGWTFYGKWTATRIDHILATRDWRFRYCRVGPSVGSPHRPLIADIEFVAIPAP